MPKINTKIAPSEHAEEDEQFIASLRAQNWDEFYGQKRVTRALSIAMQAARERKEAVDHTLLYGPPGLGKTTLAHLLAKGMNANIRITSGTTLSKVGDLAAIITSLEPHDVLFIDEIHRLPKAVEETLYPAMEDYALDIVIGKGPSAHTVRIDLPHFTLVGATTRLGLLAGPFRDRFGIVHKLEYYTAEELVPIVMHNAHKLSITVDEKSALLIGRRARGTPRIALKLLKRVRDMAQVSSQTKHVSSDLVDQTLEMLNIDHMGLEEGDRQFLDILINKYEGKPVGLSTLATSLSEDSGTIEEVIEPYLIQIGYIRRTPQGRVATEKAYGHMGKRREK